MEGKPAFSLTKLGMNLQHLQLEIIKSGSVPPPTQEVANPLALVSQELQNCRTAELPVRAQQPPQPPQPQPVSLWLRQDSPYPGLPFPEVPVCIFAFTAPTGLAGRRHEAGNKISTQSSRQNRHSWAWLGMRAALCCGKEALTQHSLAISGNIAWAGGWQSTAGYGSYGYGSREGCRCPERQFQSPQPRTELRSLRSQRGAPAPPPQAAPTAGPRWPRPL